MHVNITGRDIRPEERPVRDLMKVKAQYPAAAGLGKSSKKCSSPRDDRNIWLLVFHIWLRERKQPIDRPVRDGSLFLNANPVRQLPDTGLLSSAPSGTVAAFRIFPSLHCEPGFKV
jgi:hypothetical protein